MNFSLWDRGLHYGDGVFRTFPLKKGSIPFFDRQLKKLEDDCRRLLIPWPDEGALRGKVNEGIKNMENAVIKIIVTRGQGQRGYKPQVTRGPNVFVLVSELGDYEVKRQQGICVRLCSLRLSRQPKLAGIKHLNRLEQVLARSEWDDPFIDEGILLDDNDQVIEGIMSNLFLWDGQQLITPPLEHCGVKGLMRDLVLENAQHLGWPCKVQPMYLAELKKAAALFMTNSLWGIVPVRQFGERHYADFKIAHTLHDHLALASI